MVTCPCFEPMLENSHDRRAHGKRPLELHDSMVRQLLISLKAGRRQDI
jgi:hypothetical protein